MISDLIEKRSPMRRNTTLPGPKLTFRVEKQSTSGTLEVYVRQIQIQQYKEMLPTLDAALDLIALSIFNITL